MPDVSIVIPAYNEEARLPAAIQSLKRFMDSFPYSMEVIVVENGSIDATLSIAQSAASEDVRFKATSLEGRGKGLAVRTGVLESEGTYVLFCDADFSMPVDELPRLVNALGSGADVAIGSREAPGAQRVGEPPYRHFMGRVFNFIVRTLTVPGISDTQCGFKGFRREVARDLFSRQRIDGWAFDAEILMLARLRGYRIVEVPITWVYDATSRLSPARDTLGMLREILLIRRNVRRGTYD